MCAVSSIVGYMQDFVPPYQWTRPGFERLKDIIRRLEVLDTELGQHDCIDPEKEKYLKEIEDRLQALERG